MTRSIIKQSNQEFYTSHSGLALNRHNTELAGALKSAIPQRHGISHGDIAKSNLGQLYLGKSDFEAVSSVCDGPFFRQALRIGRVPAAERLHQRLDEHASPILQVIVDKRGQQLLMPEIEIEGWWTSLDRPEAEIIKLYQDHGTSEQFHSEFGSDLDIVRHQRPGAGDGGLRL